MFAKERHVVIAEENMTETLAAPDIVEGIAVAVTGDVVAGRQSVTREEEAPAV